MADFTSVMIVCVYSLTGLFLLTFPILFLSTLEELRQSPFLRRTFPNIFVLLILLCCVLCSYLIYNHHTGSFCFYLKELLFLFLCQLLYLFAEPRIVLYSTIYHLFPEQSLCGSCWDIYFVFVFITDMYFVVSYY